MTTPNIDVDYWMLPYKVVYQRGTSAYLDPLAGAPKFFQLPTGMAYNLHVRNQGADTCLLYLNDRVGDAKSSVILTIPAGESRTVEAISTEDTPAYIHVRSTGMKTGEQAFITIVPMPLNVPEV